MEIYKLKIIRLQYLNNFYILFYIEIIMFYFIIFVDF